MLKFDNQKFFNGYRQRFGPLTQETVDALNILLRLMEADARFAGNDTGRRQLAYCLATFKWETAHTLRPIDEYGTSAYFEAHYGSGTAVGKRLGNTQVGDGARFHGRGYVQLTGRINYARAGTALGVDLVSQPEKAKEPALAYQIAVQGILEGWFTGKRLSHYIREGKTPDYEGARRVINGQDKAQTIADIARRFAEVLLDARES